MSDEYQLRKDVDKIYGDIYNLQNKELSIYTKDEINGILKTEYPDRSELESSLATKQDTLISGTNIKTINDNSILGSGNITIEGSSGDLSDYVKKAEVDIVLMDNGYLKLKLDLEEEENDTSS